MEQERERWSSKLVRIEQFVLAGLGKDIAEFTIQVRNFDIYDRKRSGNFISMAENSTEVGSLISGPFTGYPTHFIHTYLKLYYIVAAGGG